MDGVFFIRGLERKGDGSVCEQNRPLRDVDDRGVAFVTNYDYLGRVTTESATQSGWTETITRIYGTSGTGQMHLISERLGSWTKNYEYDTYGKVISETMTYGTDITRTKTYQYDSSNGLLSRKTLSEGVTTTHYYYVSGADGLVGLYTENDAPSGTVTNNYVLITDHLGSITMMVDSYDDYNEIRYDVWGNRTVQESFLDEVIDRGYTGHEHLDQLGLIDMRGRMYDPRLGRFLSPDPFVQAPTDPQNYNRYSYCLNNPLKYTDPSGEFVWAPFLIAAAMGGVQGTMLGIQNGAKGWDLFGYIAGGAALGAISGGIAQGMAAIGANTFITQLTCNAVTSTLGAGMMSGWDGKSMLMGLGSGLLSGCVSGAISLSYDPVGLINGVLADGAVNAGIGAISGGITAAAFGGDFWDGALNGAIMGGLSGMAFGAYRGWTNAETLGVNHWTGGTLQERAQAWAKYYGFNDVEVYVLNEDNIAKYNNYHGEYRLKKEYLSNIVNAYKDGKPSPIDGITRIQDRQIYLTKATVRHATFSSSWGKGTFWHEYYHVLTQNRDEFIPYLKGLEYGGISYYLHCSEYSYFAKYKFAKPHR